MGLLKKIRDEWWWFSHIHWALWKMHVKGTIRRAIYCSRGYHKTSVGKISWGTYDSKEKVMDFSSVKYLECANCGIKMFATKEDKEMYEKRRSSERKLFKKMFRQMEDKADGKRGDNKTSGRTPKKKVGKGKAGHVKGRSGDTGRVAPHKKPKRKRKPTKTKKS